jgi:hypothetical protein
LETRLSADVKEYVSGQDSSRDGCEPMAMGMAMRFTDTNLRYDIPVWEQLEYSLPFPQKRSPLTE